MDHGSPGFIQPRALHPADTVRFQAGLAPPADVIPGLAGDPPKLQKRHENSVFRGVSRQPSYQTRICPTSSRTDPGLKPE